jgi:hypothetical protein
MPTGEHIVQAHQSPLDWMRRVSPSISIVGIAHGLVEATGENVMHLGLAKIDGRAKVTISLALVDEAHHGASPRCARKLNELPAHEVTRARPPGSGKRLLALYSQSPARPHCSAPESTNPTLIPSGSQSALLSIESLF